jgi:deferrochelatase/peroxidase EfeB
MSFTGSYLSFRDINTTVSQWLYCSILMSNNQAIFGKSARSSSETYPQQFLPQNRHFLDRARSRKQVDVLIPTI